MKKAALFLIPLILFSLGINAAWANVPSVTKLEATTTTDGRTLSITISHSSPTNVHYVSKLEVKVGEDVAVIELNPQSTTSFTEQVDVGSTGTVQVRAYCTLHGWSTWASLSEGTPEPPVDEPSNGVPGFYLAFIGLGLAGYTLYKRRSW